MSDFLRRLDRLEAAVEAVQPARPAVDMVAVCRKLEAVGLARWDEAKQFWSPTHPTLLRALIAERRAMISKRGNF